MKKVGHQFERVERMPHVAKCEHCGLHIYVRFDDWKPNVRRMGTQVYAHDEIGVERAPAKIRCARKGGGNQ